MYLVTVISLIVDPLPASTKIMAIDLSMGNQSHGAIFSIPSLGGLKFRYTENYQCCKLLIST